MSISKAVVSILAFFYCSLSISKACGPSLYIDETRFALFKNGMNGYQGLEAFYYTEAFLNSEVSDPQGLDYQKNCEEWRNYVGNADMDLRHIYEIQYQTDPKAFLEAYRTNNWYAFRKNNFINWLLQKRQKKVLEYMVLAKEAEFTQFGENDAWDLDGNDSAKISAIKAIAEKSLLMVKKSRSKFLKKRYAFQAIKMAYYAGFTVAGKEAQPYIELYDKYLKNTTTIVNPWGIYFCGLMEKVNSDAYIIKLLKAFDLSESKKIPVYNKLHNIQDKVVKTGQTFPEVEEASLAIYGAMRFGKNLQQIQRIYQINPQSKYIPFLLSREINKVENWIWSYDMLKFDNINQNLEYPTSYTQNRSNDYTYLQQLLAFVQQLDEDAKADTHFIKLAHVHLLNVQARFTDAKKILDGMKVPDEAKYRDQYLIEKIMITAKTDKILTNQVKLQLASDLQELQTNKDNYISFVKRNLEEGETYNYYDIRTEELDDVSELMVFLSHCYKAAGDILTAGLLSQKANIVTNEYGLVSWSEYYDYEDEKQNSKINKANNYFSIAYFDKYASIADVYNLIMFKHKQTKNLFEQIITPEMWADDDMFYDLIGTKYLRNQNNEEALATFKKISPDFWETQYEYSNYLPANSIFDLGTYAPWDNEQYKSYNSVSKVAILQDIVRVERELKGGNISSERKAELLRLLGNAQLNMTYNGHFWMMMSYGKYLMETYQEQDNTFQYTFYPNTLVYGDNYYRAAKSIDYYKDAMSYTRNKEAKAKLYLDICLAEGLGVRSEYAKKQLPSDIEHTRAYELARTACPDLENHFY